jgi:hypothetical protein
MILRKVVFALFALILGQQSTAQNIVDFGFQDHCDSHDKVSVWHYTRFPFGDWNYPPFWQFDSVFAENDTAFFEFGYRKPVATPTSFSQRLDTLTVSCSSINYPTQMYSCIVVRTWLLIDANSNPWHWQLLKQRMVCDLTNPNVSGPDILAPEKGLLSTQQRSSGTYISIAPKVSVEIYALDGSLLQRIHSANAEKEHLLNLKRGVYIAFGRSDDLNGYEQVEKIIIP